MREELAVVHDMGPAQIGNGSADVCVRPRGHRGDSASADLQPVIFRGGCAVSLISPSLSSFSYLTRSFSDRKGSTHPSIFDRLPHPEVVIFQGVCRETLYLSLSGA